MPTLKSLLVWNTFDNRDPWVAFKNRFRPERLCSVFARKVLVALRIVNVVTTGVDEGNEQGKPDERADGGYRQ